MSDTTGGGEGAPERLPRGADPTSATNNPRGNSNSSKGTTSRDEDGFLEEKTQKLLTAHAKICRRSEEFEKVLPRSTSIELEKARKESERMVLCGVEVVSGVHDSTQTFTHVMEELHRLSQMLLRKSSGFNTLGKDWERYARFVVRGMCKEVNAIIDEVESYLEEKGIDVQNEDVLFYSLIDYDISVNGFRGV